MRRRPMPPEAWERNKEIYGMSRECSWKRTNEVQVDLLDLLHRLCGQWRRIVVCALVSAVLAGAGSYVISKNAAVEDTSEELVEAEPQPEPVPLTREEQVQGVESARRLAQETEALETYVAGSVLMQIDSYHKNSVQLLFRVEGAAGWTMQKIVEKYLGFLANDAAVDAIQKADGEMEGIEKLYLSELFWAAQKTSGTYLDGEGSTLSGVLLSVETTGLDAAMAANLAADIQAVLEEYHLTVEEECGSHTLALLSSGQKERADSALLAQQQEKRTLLATGRANLKAMVDAFDDEQKAMYAAAETGSTDAGSGNEDSGNMGAGSGNEDSGNTGVGSVLEKSESIDADSGLDGQGKTGMAAGAIPEGQPGLEEGIEPEETKGSVSVLYVLLGFLGGIFVYSAAYAGWYLMRDTVKSAGEFRSYYTFPFYGSIVLSGGAGKGSAGRDAFERGKVQVLNRVRLSCKKQGVSGFCVATDFSPDEKEKECIEGILSKLKEWGYDVVLAENIGGNISMWDTLAETGAVLMVCRLGSTTHRMIDDAMEFYLESGVSVLGAAALE